MSWRCEVVEERDLGTKRADLSFVRHYHRPTRKVRVDSIYARLGR